MLFRINLRVFRLDSNFLCRLCLCFLCFRLHLCSSILICVHL
jgi:hypothetical protein